MFAALWNSVAALCNPVAEYRARRKEEAEISRLARLDKDLAAFKKRIADANEGKLFYLEEGRREGIASFEQAVICIAAVPLENGNYRVSFFLDKSIPGIGGPNLLVGDYPTKLYSVLTDKRPGGFLIHDVGAGTGSDKGTIAGLINLKGASILNQFFDITHVKPLDDQQSNSVGGKYGDTWKARFGEARSNPDRPEPDVGVSQQCLISLQAIPRNPV